MGEILRGVGAGQNGAGAFVKVMSCRIGKGVECLGVNQIAQRIAEEASVQIQISQRSPLAVANTTHFEVGSESGRTPDRIGQRRFANEEHGADERFYGATNAFGSNAR